MRLGVFEAEDWEVEAFRRLDPQAVVSAEPLTPERARAHPEIEVVTAFIHSRLNRETLAALPRLKLVATRSTGFDHIDLGYCREAGVTVCNVPDYGDPTVAEHAFALLLAVSRRIVKAADRTRTGEFDTEGLRGFDLAGRTLGVVGAGRIGRRVLRIARGFSMHALACDPAPDPAAAADIGFAYVSLDELLRRSDVISLHLPGNARTRNLIDDAQFAAMKPGAVLINTARGGVVNTAALIRALDSGLLAGAGLDVFADEPLLREESEVFREGRRLSAEQLRSLLAANTLLRMANVVATPHIAYDTEEAVRRIAGTTIGNIEAFMAGCPRNVVGAVQEP